MESSITIQDHSGYVIVYASEQTVLFPVGPTIISAENLLSMERLDRSSPELWPEKIPGMQEFPSRTVLSKAPQWMKDFNDEDYELLNGLSKMTAAGLVAEVKKLYDAAYQLGVEESREMTRGKYLEVLMKKPKPKPEGSSSS